MNELKQDRLTSNLVGSQASKKEEVAEFIDYSIIPIDLGIYRDVIEIFKRALGILYDNDYYVAKKPDYLKNHVFFDRYCFDVISLMGDNMVVLSSQDVEYIMRKVYQQSTHFMKIGNSMHIQLLKADTVKSQFSLE